VIIPCYNAGPWVAEAVQSCLDQTYQPLETIVVDDGSTDQSRQIVSDLSRKANGSVRLIQSAHQDAPAARNKGLAVASGEYVQFLDADDVLSPRKIELQMAAATHHHEAVLYGTWLHLRKSNEGWTTEYPQKHMRGTGDLLQERLEDKWLAGHSFLWPRQAVIDLGGWDESLTAWQDSDLHFRAILQGFQFCFVPDSTVYYRVGHNASSVSSRTNLHALKSRILVLDKVQTALERRGDLEEYSNLLAGWYYSFARGCALEQSNEAQECFHKFLRLSPDGRVPGTLANHWATRLLGVVRKEKLARTLSIFRTRRTRR